MPMFAKYLSPKQAAETDTNGVTEAQFAEALRAKRNGAKCESCGAPIWAFVYPHGICMCFSCTTGEADASEDYELG